MSGGTVPETIDVLYAEAYALIDQGICFDEVGHGEGAKTMYERGLALIERAGNMPGAQDSPLYQKMVKSREYILQRLVDLRHGRSLPDTKEQIEIQESPPGPPPAYPTLPEATPFDSISGALLAMGDVRQATEIFCVPDGVQIFFIEGEMTSVPSFPTCLKIFKFSDENPNGPNAFLQVGDWVHPLMAGRSPVLHSTYGAYIFPNTKGPEPDSSVGLILPADLDASLVQEFDRLMQELTALRKDDSVSVLTAEENERLSTKIAKILLQGTEWLVGEISKGTEKTEKFVRDQSVKVKDKTVPAEQSISVDPRVQTSVHYLRKGSKVAVRVSGYLVNKLGDAAVYLGKKVAKSAEGAVSKHGGSAANQAFHDALEVGGAGLSGAAAIYVTLEKSARTLAKSIANETVQVVNYKYGDDAGRVTENAMFAGYNTGLTAWNISEMGPKAIAKRTAKKGGLAVLEDLGQSAKERKTSTPKVADGGPS